MGHSGQRKWDFYLRFLLYVMVVLDMPQIEALWVQPFEPPFFFSTPPERYWHRKIGREILNVFAMLFSIDDTLSARASIQVPLFVIVMQKSYSHAGIYSRLLLWIDPKTKKWLKNDRNFHLKIERQIGREKPIDFSLFFGFVERPLRELKFTPLFFNFFKVTMSNSLVL